jgi:hypothetical protein
LLAEKRNCIGVKLLVEANAIKAWRVATWAAFRWRFIPSDQFGRSENAQKQTSWSCGGNMAL